MSWNMREYHGQEKLIILHEMKTEIHKLMLIKKIDDWYVEIPFDFSQT